MLEITVNGKKHKVEASPRTALLYVLRNELGLNGPKFGCGVGQCGACTIHLGSKAVRSCIVPVSAATTKPITTLEGLSGVYSSTHPTGTKQESPLHPLQEAFIEEQAAQCGYCTNGMIMTAASLLAQNSRPTNDEIREALTYNLCRCGTHMRIQQAIKSAAEKMARGNKA